MSNMLGDIEYNKEEYLNLGADYPLIEQNLKTEINIINLKENEEEKFEQQDDIQDEEEETRR